MKEADLPARLQKEFARLAGGLLSNVALATIASIRDATHHVLSKITAPMDGPYFHHRPILPMVGDAEEYSVDVVLSDLKSEVDKQRCRSTIRGFRFDCRPYPEMASDALTLPSGIQRGAGTSLLNISLDDAIRLVTDGCTVTHGKITGR